MSEIDDIKRRRFLKMTAGAAGGLTALSMLPPTIRQAMAASTVTSGGTISDVRHVVIFMQENRSFDHYFGSLAGVRGFNDPVPHPLPSSTTTGNNVWYQPTSTSSPTTEYMLPFHMPMATTSSTCVNASAFGYTDDLAINNQMKFNAWNTSRTAGMGMGFYNSSDLPFYYALAENFTICDNYYCSTLTDTNPNRLMLFTGSNGLSVNYTPVQLDDTQPSAGLTWTTYAERLQDAGVSWKVYQESDNFDDNPLEWFANFMNASTTSPLYTNGMATVSSIVTAFQNDVTNNTLPTVSWIVAPSTLSEHPDYQPPDGENLTAQLLAALASNPTVYASTVFILNYDENGGFFDHMPPPVPATSTADNVVVSGYSTVSTTGEISTVNESGDTISASPIGLGYRVPMIIISPWTVSPSPTTGPQVCSQVFDHTSVLQFLELVTGVTEPNISAWRRAVCGNLFSAFNFSNTNTIWPSLPSTSTYVATSTTECDDNPAPTVPTKQTMPTGAAGVCPAAALPYIIDAQGSLNVSTGKYYIDFINNSSPVGPSGSQAAVAAVFHAYSLNRTNASEQGPWIYTIGAADSYSDDWTCDVFTDSVYALEVHGPNGFMRKWMGSGVSASVMPETAISYNASAGTVELTMSNAGTSSCTMTVTNGYNSSDVRTYTVPAGGNVSDTWNLSSSNNWYDLQATVSGLSNWGRRLCGHMENGSPSTTEPPHTQPAL
ncbi:phosphocholine-specific phospholipase C [Dyella caseinilytica]|uniref:phospholipase C n=1 Tax=Dyella caseinilytica TaxID=1849581 RepID=A0ABX7GVK3_9GAMM|nr:phospholipase C, phosphocholine-specific [Dyella caseinilytica]QRN54344.1 phospholipase C, phosphocholine-specific [Dyella caseinilytica]GFZ93442.1 non-hemolytic phospholipase C [Dyella caseinilytica]